MHTQLLCKLTPNNLIVLDFNLVLYLSNHSPLRSVVSATQISLSRLFHPSTGAPDPSVQGPGSPRAPLSSINKLLIHGDILFQCLGLPVALSLPICIDVRAAKSTSNGYTEAAEAHGHWRDGVFLCFASRKPLFRQPRAPWEKRKCRLTSEHWVDWGGHSYLPCCLTWWIIFVRHLQPSISPPLQKKLCVYVFIFSIWDNSTP